MGAPRKGTTGVFSPMLRDTHNVLHSHIWLFSIPQPSFFSLSAEMVVWMENTQHMELTHQDIMVHLDGITIATPRGAENESEKRMCERLMDNTCELSQG